MVQGLRGQYEKIVIFCLAIVQWKWRAEIVVYWLSFKDNIAKKFKNQWDIT